MVAENNSPAMSDNKKIDESIDFVSSHYDGSLLPQEGWRRFSRTHRVPWLRRNIAAACIGAIVLAASAASIYYISTSENSSGIETTEASSPSNNPTPVFEPYKIVRIQFSDAPLADVVKEIEKVYGVKVTNMPKEEVRLTISYEGNAYDVVETINELLGTNLAIEENEEPQTTK